MTKRSAHLRHRQLLDDRLETLLHGMHLDELRGALSRLTSGAHAPAQTKDDAKEQIRECGRSTTEIMDVLYRVQAETPFSHCFVAQLSAPLTTSQWKKLSKVFSIDNAAYKVGHSSSDLSDLALTFERIIDVVEWVQVGGDTKKRKVVQILQPLVLRLRKDSRVLFLSYPGFNQGHVEESLKVRYQDEVNEILELVRHHIGISVKPLPIQDAVTKLLIGESTRVVRIGADLINDEGEFKVSASRQGSSAEAAFVALLKRGLPTASPIEMRRIVNEAFKNTSMDGMTLLWTNEKVLTRLDFWTSGCEILFVWKGQRPDYAVINSILSLLTTLLHSDAPSIDVAWAALIAAAPEHVFRPAECGTKWGLAPDLIQTFFIDAVKAGLLEPVYRLASHDARTRVAMPFWANSLQQLAKQFSTEDEVIIDGRDPRNIEVAFRRPPIQESAQAVGDQP